MQQTKQPNEQIFLKKDTKEKQHKKKVEIEDTRRHNEWQNKIKKMLMQYKMQQEAQH